MANYEIAPAVLRPFVPGGTELDAWGGRHFISVVGFRFLNTRVWNVPFPFHRNFEEVNLRFYVRRQAPDGWRRGVVFIKEIVPRRAIAFLARTFYNEPYVALPMSHRLEMAAGRLQSAAYAWGRAGQECILEVNVSGEPMEWAAGSEAEFITEHYWGYNRQRDGSTLEYRVEHPRWRIWRVTESCLEGDMGRLYGSQFVEALAQPPSSVFLAEGSAVNVYPGRS